ncbi:hypothetical protein CGCSCA5_v010042 [Colletotrichum siamense]|nr:hypothetical protein CGCSCA5_v010042 [Colletotrichum siamense]
MGNVEKQDEVLSGLKTQDEVIDLKKSFTESEYGTGPDGRGMRTRDAQLGPMELLDLDDINTSKKLSENRGWIYIPANDIEMAEVTPPSIPQYSEKSTNTEVTTYLNWESYDTVLMKPGHGYGLTRHQRRTLDQSYYSGLGDTKSRDAGQTVSKWTGERIPENGHQEAIGSSLFLMVDQLWVWVLDEATIVTCFPFHDSRVKADTQLASSLDIMSSVFSPSVVEPYWKWYNLVTAILARSVMGIFQVAGDKLGDPLAIYRWAIANKPARHATLLEAFWKRRLSQAAGGRSDEGSEELELALELADILDELNIFKRFLDQQYTTHLKAVRILGHNGNLEERDQFPAMNSRKAEVRRLVADAEQTHRMVLELPDLELKAASLSEARTTRQGQAIMLFTIITIIFIPLSFFVSYFGQNVSELTGDSQNPTSGQVWKIAAPISAVVIVFALAVSFVIMDPWKSWKDFAVKIYRSFLGRLRKWRGVKDMETQHRAA